MSHDFKLGGLPATGQGAKLRITFGPDGNVTQLSSSLRKLEQAGEEPIIPSDEARKACERLYDDGVRQGEPTLGYLLPALGAVEAIYPSYTCNPSSEQGKQAHLQVPADRGHRPEGRDRGLAQRREDPRRRRRAAGDGSVYKWSSSSTALSENEGRRSPTSAARAARRPTPRRSASRSPTATA